MIINGSEINHVLKDYLTYAGINIKFLDEISNYLTFLLKKNLELNLVSRKLTPETLIVEHIYDCLAGFEYFEDYETITDLGSGGGFPGILLGIVFKDKKIKLVEKSPKKVAFLQEAVKVLNLKNVAISLNLVGDEKIDSSCITARAFKSIDEIIGFTRYYFKRGGEYLLYKGKIETINEEIDLAEKSYKFNFHILKIADKMVDKERHLVKIKKI